MFYNHARRRRQQIIFMNKILIVEDEEIIRNALKKLLVKQGFDVTEAGSIGEAKKCLVESFNMIISDLRLPGGQGTDLIALAGQTPVLIMTSYASMRSAVDAMKLGAVDYIAKPFDHKEMVETVTRILNDHSAVKSSGRPLSSTAVNDTKTANTIIGSSVAMKTVFSNIAKVAPTNATVLIYGETGTGKELVASAIHQQSPRANKPLISVNCAAIPENLIEAELFGHEKGAFTGAETARSGLIAASDGGTLFLDEIGELPLEAQARLLRVLQENEVRAIGAVESRRINLRLIAATHRDLQQLCREGKFREDLYFRINVFQINLPPLRERRDDILELTQAFLSSLCAQLGKAIPALADETRHLLQQYSWPGNVRELKNVLQRALIMNDGQRPLLPEHLELQSHPNLSTPPLPAAVSQDNVSLDDYFIKFVQENESALSETELAKRLGISRKNLWERRQKLGIPRRK